MDKDDIERLVSAIGGLLALAVLLGLAVIVIHFVAKFW